MPFLLRLTGSTESTTRDYHRCGSCGSIAVLEDVVPSAASRPISQESRKTLSPAAKLGQRHMIELGTNFDVQAFASTQVCGPPPGRMLDIGCGLGIGLDYARHTFASDVIGIDPGLLAQRSSQVLGFPLLRGYFPVDDGLLNEPFNTIEGWEVIEHVSNPLDFLECARAKLTDEGLLALSTPNACTIVRQTSASALLSCLSPGEHRIIFSPNGLSALLARAGFPASRIEDKGGHFFALSRRGSSEPPTLQPAGGNLLSYYHERSEQLSQDPSFSTGLLMKLTVAYLAQGDWPRLQETLIRADRVMKTHWGISLEDRTAIKAHLTDSLEDAFLEQIPLPLPFLLFARGRLAQRMQGRSRGRDIEMREYMTLATNWGRRVAGTLASVRNTDQVLINMIRKAEAIAAA